MIQEELEEIQLTSELAPRKSEKQKLTNLLHSQSERREMCGEVLSESVIETVDHKRHAHDKEIRLSTVQVCQYVLVFDCVKFIWVHFQSGRKGRTKYGYSKKRLSVHSSTTNKEKIKNKAFMMIKHKRTIRGKSKKSFREKQMVLRNSLLKQRRVK